MAQRFQVVTYNVQFDSPVAPPAASGRIVQERFDLAGFQEVFEPLGFSFLLFGIPFLIYRAVKGHLGMRRALESALGAQGFFTEWTSSSRPLLGIAILILGAQRSGLLCAAKEFPAANAPVRFEVNGTDSRTLSDTPAGTTFPRNLGREIRIAQYLSVTLKPPPNEPNLGDLPIDFFNVHLTDDTGGRRQEEVRKLLDFVDEKRRVSSADIQIVVGDFNATPNDPEIQNPMVTQGNFVDVWAAVGAGQGLTSDARLGLSERIDYVFVSRNALGAAPNLRLISADLLYDATPLISDHLGVRAVFERG